MKAVEERERRGMAQPKVPHDIAGAGAWEQFPAATNRRSPAARIVWFLKPDFSRRLGTDVKEEGHKGIEGER